MNDRTFVYVVENDRARRVEVTPGQSLGSMRRIESPDLKENARIVVKGVHLLDDGEKVVVMGEEAR